MKVSVIVPSRGCLYLKWLLSSLREQTLRPHEIVLVLKSCDIRSVEMKCNSYRLNCVILEQTKGFFTSALNLGRQTASGDLLLFTDDDAIPLRGWVARYVTIFNSLPRHIVGVSSRDIYVDIERLKLAMTPDDIPYIKIYRRLIRSRLEPPLEIFEKYRLGVYINKMFKIAHGPCIPDGKCFSLPFRGVNMGFRGEVADLLRFPEHPELRRAPGNEQYVGLLLVLRGYDTVYIPSNPVLHIYRRDSLSRTKRKDEIRREIAITRVLFRKVIRG